MPAAPCKQHLGLYVGVLAGLVGAMSLAPGLAEAKTECRNVAGAATAPVKDEARDKARQNAFETAQATMGAGITQAAGGWIECGFTETDGVINIWECRVEVSFCTTEVNIPRPSLPGYTPPATFSPKVGG